MIVLSSIIFILGFVFYGSTVVRGTSTPVASSWAVWAVISFSNALVCTVLNDTVADSAIALTDAVCVGGVLFAVFRKVGFDALGGKDLALMVFAALASLLSLVQPELSTVLVQIPLLIAAAPTLRAALDGEEHPGAWAFWTFGLTLNLAMTSGGAFAWVYPVTMFLLHFGVMCGSAWGLAAKGRVATVVTNH